MSLAVRPRVLCMPTGPDEYAVAVVRALATAADVVFVLPENLLLRYRDDLPPTVQLHPLRWRRHRDPRCLSSVAAFAGIVRRTKPDVIHFLGDSVTWLVLALPFLRSPLVVTVHDVHYHPGDTQSRRVPMATIQLLRRAAHALIVHGEGLAADLAATGVAPPAGIHVVEHPVLDRQVRLARRLGLRRRPDDGAPVVLFFGRVMAYKGLGLLIEASDRVVRSVPDARFVVAGQGPDLERLRAELARRPWFEVRDRNVPDSEVAQLFLDADLVVLPYIEASQSGVAALAAGFGRPVVATAVGELGPLVKATGMGPVVPPRPIAVADAIVSLLRDPAKLAWHAAAAAAATRGRLSAPRAAAANLAVYRQTMALGLIPDRQPSTSRYSEASAK